MMKHLLLLPILLIITCNTYSQDLPRVSDFASTFNILKDSSTGTCFMIYENQKNYIVTAKHVLGKISNKQKIKFSIQQNGNWSELSGEVLLHSNPQIDVAVIITNFDTLYTHAIKIGSTYPILGQEGFFLGYPLGIATHDNIMDGFPIALVKKCTFSGSFSQNGVIGFFLDGHNNPGFSGGPVLFRDFNNKSSVPYLIGIISGYINERKEMITTFGNFKYDENSGIILCYGANHIKEILSLNVK